MLSSIASLRDRNEAIGARMRDQNGATDAQPRCTSLALLVSVGARES
jgi:hypothetical protein